MGEADFEEFVATIGFLPQAITARGLSRDAPRSLSVKLVTELH